MTPAEILEDLYNRLTSRKFWGFLLMIGFAVWNFREARMSAVEFQTAVTAAFAIYGVAEGIADGMGARYGKGNDLWSQSSTVTETHVPDAFVPPTTPEPTRRLP